MKKYTVETIRETLITVTDRNLAKIYFEQMKDEYNYLTFNEVVENENNIYITSLAIHHK